jgi:hypothetical protein
MKHFQTTKPGEVTAAVNLTSSLVHSHFLMERTISDLQFQAATNVKGGASLLGLLPCGVLPSCPAVCLLPDKRILMVCDRTAESYLA